MILPVIRIQRGDLELQRNARAAARLFTADRDAAKRSSETEGFRTHAAFRRERRGGPDDAA